MLARSGRQVLNGASSPLQSCQACPAGQAALPKRPSKLDKRGAETHSPWSLRFARSLAFPSNRLNTVYL